MIFSQCASTLSERVKNSFKYFPLLFFFLLPRASRIILIFPFYFILIKHSTLYVHMKSFWIIFFEGSYQSYMLCSLSLLLTHLELFTFLIESATHVETGEYNRIVWAKREFTLVGQRAEKQAVYDIYRIFVLESLLYGNILLLVA